MPCRNPFRIRAGNRTFWLPLETVFILAVTVLVSLLSEAAIYIDFGDFPGEAVEPKHRDWINLLSVSNSITRPLRGDGNAEFSEFTIEKETDSSTPKLCESILTGTVHDKVHIDFVETDSSAQPVFMKYELESVKVTSYSINGSGLDDGSIPTETLSLNFDKVTWAYFVLGLDGMVIKQVNTYWDIPLNEGWIDFENHPPAVEPIPDQRVQPGETRQVELMVSDYETDPDQLQVKATTNAPELIKDLSVSGTDGQRTLTFTASSLYSGAGGITVEVSDGTDATAVSFAVLIDVEMTPWEAFLAANFSPEELEDPDLVNPNGDPDEDGIKTVIEFGLVSNPREYTYPGELIRFSRRNTVNGPVIVLQFRRRTDAGKLGPIPWMAPESLLFEPLDPNSPNYEETTAAGSNPFYEDVTGIIHLDPREADMHLIRFQVDLE